MRNWMIQLRDMLVGTPQRALRTAIIAFILYVIYQPSTLTWVANQLMLAISPLVYPILKIVIGVGAVMYILGCFRPKKGGGGPSL